MGTSLELSGRTGRRALLSLLATVAVWMAFGAVQANAATVTASPFIRGAGNVVTGGYNCGNGVISNTFVVACGPAVADSGIFGGAISLTLTAVPRSSGGWTFTGWEGCPAPAGNTCTMTAGIFQNLAFAPVANFRDFTGPGITGLGTTLSTSQARTVSFSWGADDLISSFQCQMDSLPLESCSSGKTYTSLSEGTHTFRVRGIDLLGNIGTFATQDVRILETALAAVAGTPADGGFINTKAATFKMTSGAGLTFDCLLDTPAAGVPAFTNCGSKGVDGSLTKSFVAADFPTDGVYQFQARARDGSALDATPVVRTFTVDTVAPVITGLASPTITDGIVTTALNATFTWGVTEVGGLNRFECKLDDGAFAACTSGKAFTNLPFGGHTFSVRGVDKAGNTGPAVSRSWTVAARDEDGDGFNQRSDCNDSNPAINPIATDIPDNGIDENCDGADAINLDRDGDGFQRPADCDDGNPAIKPGVTDILDNGIDENCDGADSKSPPATRIVISMPFFVQKSTNSFTTFTQLAIKGIPAGSTLKVTCKAPKGKKCPTKSFTKKNPSGTFSLKKYLKKKLAAGTKVTATVTKPGNFIGAVKIMTIKKKARPSFVDRCIKPGSKKAGSC